MVWREILSEGPALASVPEETFWQKRQTYITKTYGETAAAYKKKVLDELPKLDAAGGFFEVVLWFDTDLMCRVNLLYLLHRLYQLQPNAISVCTPLLDQTVSLLKPNKLQQLFLNRQQQTGIQLAHAHELWHLYGSPDPLQMQRYLQQHKEAVAPHLSQALALHLKRFPDCANGLGHPEKALLRLVQQGAFTKEQLFQQFWKQLHEYGFGDWQLLQLLKYLHPELVEEKNELKLTSLGAEVLENKAAFKPKAHWLGGVKIDTGNKLCYNTMTKQLQISS
ncbi:hypothetical protein GCM10027443_03760 [Pontibacter brevis]